MRRWLFIVPLVAWCSAGPAAAPNDEVPPKSPVLQRFLAQPDPSPGRVRALRRLEAQNDHFEKSAWMDVWTDLDETGFHYQVVAEGGSDYIRTHVLRAALDSESEMRSSGGAERAAFTPDNYVFDDGVIQPDGLLSFSVKPRHKGPLFVEGSLFISPDDGELVRLEGRLSKTPSFWTRRVDIVRYFRRVAGFRMPVAVDSVASVRIAGRSTFRMTYDYESVNGQRVGNPQPTHLAQLR